LNAQTRFTLCPQAISSTVGDETVILDLASGTYFGLDPVGARIWTLLGEGKTVGETRDVLLSEYEVERDRLEADLLALANQLIEENLITMNDGE
jgi:hypothetical protein